MRKLFLLLSVLLIASISFGQGKRIDTYHINLKGDLVGLNTGLELYPILMKNSAGTTIFRVDSNGTVTNTGTSDLTITNTAAAGDKAINAAITQNSTALTGNLIGAGIVATNGTSSGVTSGVIYGIEAKARAATSGNVGAAISRLDGVYSSVDVKNKTATTIRAFEASLDGGAGGASTEAVAFEAFNNSSATQTSSYAFSANGGTAGGHKAYTADMRLQNGALINNSSTSLLTITEATVAIAGALTSTGGIDIGTSQSLTGTTGITIGSGTATTAITSSDWAIDATGAATGMGAITSNGAITGTSFIAPTYDVTGATGITFGSADVTAFTFSGISETLVLTPSADTWTLTTTSGATAIAFSGLNFTGVGTIGSGKVSSTGGVDLGTSQALTGTTAITVGSGTAVTNIISSGSVSVVGAINSAIAGGTNVVSAGLLGGGGTSTAATQTLGAAGGKGFSYYLSSTSSTASDVLTGYYMCMNYGATGGAGAAPSGDVIRGRAYLMGDASGATMLSGGNFTTELEATTASNTGLTMGLKGNLVLPAGVMTNAGTYHGIQAELFLSAASTDPRAYTIISPLSVCVSGTAPTDAAQLSNVAMIDFNVPANELGDALLIDDASSANTVGAKLKIRVNGTTYWVMLADSHD